MKRRGLFAPEVDLALRTVHLEDLQESNRYEAISPAALLVQTGYLTIRETMGSNLLRLDYPNREVKMSMRRLLADEMLRQRNEALSDILVLPKILTDGSGDELVRYLNGAFNAVNYERYPVRDEAGVSFGVQMLLTGVAGMTFSEVHGALGRSDLEVFAGQRHWVFEFKYARETAEVDSLLEEAVAQVRARRYGESADSRELLRMALVFDAAKRRFAAWRRAD